MEGTEFAHTRRKETNGGGQFSYESSIGWEDLDFEERGSGTEGGFVVLRKAAKYKHSAGPRKFKFKAQVLVGVEHTCNHEIAFRTCKDINIEKAFGFGLSQRRLEVAMEAILNILL